MTEYIEEEIAGVKIRRRVLPWRVFDPYGVWHEAARFEREWCERVEMPMLMAMAKDLDRMWGCKK